MAKNEENAIDVVAETELETADDSSALELLGGGTEIKDEIRELVSGAPSMYSSIKGGDFASRKSVVEKLTNSEPVADNIGTVINLQHVIVQSVAMANRVTGRMEDQPRVILIDADGTAYHAISKGLFLAVRNILGVMGEPDQWTEPLPVVVKREKAAIGSFFTIEIAA